MNRRLAIVLCTGAAIAPIAAAAQAVPGPAATPAKISPMPTAAEQPFITRLQQEIPRRYATIDAAKKAGYFQYTPEDSTGAISYVNLKYWNSLDFNFPNQLWYDVNGRLLGVDYTLLKATSPAIPATLFGYRVEPGHWGQHGDHMHWGFKAADGSLKLGAMQVAKFKDAGGDPNPTQGDVPANKAALVKAGVPGLTSPDQVQFVFLHPAMWDLVVWVLPNPDGAFADANPNVKPSTAKSGGM
ncbi:MAG TPA: hypothetical protein VN603_08215 [Candidatus Acidoferrales bacterium]|nr:hypothetical protein [Candidatus Acidoferrales bacterium]